MIRKNFRFSLLNEKILSFLLSNSLFLFLVLFISLSFFVSVSFSLNQSHCLIFLSQSHSHIFLFHTLYFSLPIALFFLHHTFFCNAWNPSIIVNIIYATLVRDAMSQSQDAQDIWINSVIWTNIKALSQLLSTFSNRILVTCSLA